jgi:CBS domain-containing protein/gamma-glutamylcysteine synthetase
MGDQNIAIITDSEEKHEFTRYLLTDIKALEKMLDQNMFEDDIQRIGAEQEVGIVGKDWLPKMVHDKILDDVNDNHFTPELGRFNIEINLDPQLFKGKCFAQMHGQLNELLNKAKVSAAKIDAKIVLAGIMPTLGRAQLKFEYMTPNPRFEALNLVMASKKKANFELNIIGVDELITSHANILYEAFNTSFQVHYQLSPKSFASKYNWAQAIAGPVLATVANSPLLMGKRLWAETRIALFQQSIDTRNSANLKRDIEPRVTFGAHWLKNSVLELYQDSITRHPSLFAPDKLENSLELLDQNITPKLRALCMQSGTVYMWNRVCYGISENGKPHLRIENRYMPSGPTTVDEIANAAFWLGLMAGMPKEYEDLNKVMDFESARFNFYNAARLGLECNFDWMGKSYHARDLILEKFIPWAHEGLNKMKVDVQDINHYLSIIQHRVDGKINGATWMINNFNKLVHKSTPKEASVSLTRLMVEMEETSEPVHLWPAIKHSLKDGHKHFYMVEQIMTTDIPTVHADDLLDLVINFMIWRNVRYIAVENRKHELVGMVASRILVRLLKDGWKEGLTAKDIMVKELITVGPQTSTQEAIGLMSDKNIGCLPVVSKNRLLGMLTEREIVNIVHLTQKFRQPD